MRKALIVFVILLTATIGQVKADDAVYKAFGEKAGLTQLVDDFIARVLADKRISGFFAQANIPHLKMELVEQFCALTDGPCTYQGRDMISAHKGMRITDSAFNALAEDLQISMTSAGIAFRMQNHLVAKLAAMEKQIAYQ